MAGEVEAAKVAVDAATKLIETEPLLGSLLAASGSIIVGLLWYIRAQHQATGQLHKDFEAGIADVQEKRIAEIKSALTAIGDATAVLGKVAETVKGVAQTLEGIGAGQVQLAGKLEAAFAGIGRIEQDIKGLEGRVDRACRARD